MLEVPASTIRNRQVQKLMFLPRSFAGLALLLCVLPAFAADPPDPAEGSAPKQTAQQFMDSLKPQHGSVKLPNGVATLNLPESFFYLDPADANRVLVDAWGNPPSAEKTLGMIVPADVSLISEDGWAVVITYDKDGHVKDDDAKTIDYDKLLKEQQQRQEEGNAQRVRDGYHELYLVGWAEPPSYDAATHKMIWAQELSTKSAIGHSDDNSLNYNIRVLGREGVLVLNAVAAMHDLAKIKAQMPTVLAFTNFNDGSRYSDFNPNTDKLAEYGLAALIGGGIAAKVGLFAKIGLILLALKKFVVLGLVAVAGFFGKFFKRRPRS